MDTILLVLGALIPAVILCVYIYIKDRAEKEPIGLLLALLVCGAISYIPILITELISGGILNIIFSPFFIEIEGELLLTGVPNFIYCFLDNFICVALVEEGFKFLFLYIVTSKNKNFNSLFDGMIYAIFVSLGFAGLENILYAFSYGWGTVLLRAVTSIPGHMFFAVLMGYYYSWWNIYKKAKVVEKDWINRGLATTYNPAFDTKKCIALAIIMPVLAHGAYDFCCSINSTILNLVFVVLLIFLYIHCFRTIKKMSDIDSLDNEVAVAFALKYHPEVVEQMEKNREERERVVVEKDTTSIE